ncbi:galactan 5-O-arabinofuranosyltransferase [uncultured Corynebacterium sp.]|uniref:galactan 5-O-arabinofuranosyltransferase n=1 Tax=uncultured Corynebacterium sp. TaxID=159447 RepID=UPI0025D980F4|nr:galactan 5-O-arabinofuranosyltransferase [uncultured Corynebacterium sp.]
MTDGTTANASSSATENTPESTPATTPTVAPRPGALSFLGQVVGAGVLAALVTLVAWIVLARTHLPAFSSSNVTKALASAGAILVLLVLGLVIYRMLHPRSQGARNSRNNQGNKNTQPTESPRWKRVLCVLVCWLAPAALVITLIGIPLAATRLYLGGISVDQAFRTQFLTRMTEDPGFGDMAYPDMPSFYPRLWFLAGGIFAKSAGLAGWAAFQPWTLITLAATASVLVPVWHRITGSLPLGSVIAAATTVTLLYVAPEEPYAAIVAVGMPAAAAIAGRAMRGSRAAMAGLIVYLGFSANLYTLFTGISAACVVLVALVIAWQSRHRRSTTTGADAGTGTPPFLPPLLRLLTVGLGSGIIALLGWGPYFLALLTSEHGSTGRAQHYLPEIGTELPTPFFDFSVVGALSLICIVWMVLNFRDRTVRCLLCGLVVSYGWVVLSMIAPLGGTTLLGFRMELPISLLLVTGGVLALDQLRSSGVAKAYPAFVTPQRAPQVTAVIGVLLTFATAAYAVSVPLHLREEIDLAYTDTDGDAERGDTLPADSTVYFSQVDTAIRELRGDNPADTVVLTDEQSFVAYHPYPVFQAISAHYANPLGEYEERNAEIERWTRIDDPTELREAMDAVNRDRGWRPPDALLLRGQLEDDGSGDIGSFSYRMSEDIYPNDPNVRFRPVSFRATAFSEGWTLRQIGPFVLAVRR